MHYTEEYKQLTIVVNVQNSKMMINSLGFFRINGIASVNSSWSLSNTIAVNSKSFFSIKISRMKTRAKTEEETRGKV